MGRRTFFRKKPFMGRQLYGGIVTVLLILVFWANCFCLFKGSLSENFSWRNICFKIKPWPFHRVLKRFILEFNSSEVSKVASCCMGYWYIFWNVNTRNRVKFEKHPLHTMFLGLGIWCKVCLLSKYSNMVTCNLMPWS